MPIERPVMRLYHATTQKKAKLYRHTGAIRAPVRGFTTMQAAMAWAMAFGKAMREMGCRRTGVGGNAVASLGGLPDNRAGTNEGMTCPNNKRGAYAQKESK